MINDGVLEVASTSHLTEGEKEWLEGATPEEQNKLFRMKCEKMKMRLIRKIVGCPLPMDEPQARNRRSKVARYLR